MIGIPNGSGLFPHQTVTSLLKLKKPCPCMVQIVERQRTDKARNYIVKQELESGATHLLFIDDDNPPAENTIERFFQADKDIVCAPIPTRNPNKNGFHDLCIFNKVVKDDLPFPLYENINKIDLSKGKVFKVDACGMGCTMIKRNVLEKLWEKYEGSPFAYGELDIDGKKRTMSEDCEFSERAVNEGFEIWCDTNVIVPHICSQKIIQFSDIYLI